MPSLIKRISSRAPSLPRIPEPDTSEDDRSSERQGPPVVYQNAWTVENPTNSTNGNTGRPGQENGFHMDPSENLNYSYMQESHVPNYPIKTNENQNFHQSRVPPRQELQSIPQSPGWKVFAERKSSTQKNPGPPNVAHGKQAAPRVRYNRTPVRLTVAGDWALKQCEDLTTWANKILKPSNCDQIVDIRKSIGDGTTLVILTQTVCNGTIQGINREITSRQERVDNVRLCLDYLGTAGVDLTAIDAEDIADGNLKATLLLVGNIRDRFEPNNNDSTESRNDKNLSNSGVTQSAENLNMPGAITLPGVAGVREQPLGISDYPTSPHRRGFMMAEDLLPGTTSKEEVVARPQSVPPGAIIPASELLQNGDYHYGVDDRNHQLPQSNHSNNNNNIVGYTMRQMAMKPAVPSPKPQRQAGPMTNAWSQEAKKSQMTRGAPSVEERLKSLISSPPSSVKDQPISRPIDDGELLIPPQPQPRVSTTPGGSSYHQRIPSQGDNMGPHGNSYIPSKPSERYNGSRAEAILNRQTLTSVHERQNSRTAPLGHDNQAYNKSRETSPVRQRDPNQNEGSQMRDAWNKLYGVKQVRPESRGMMPLNSPGRSNMYHPALNITAAPQINNVDKPPQGQLNISSGMRTSPMGQSSSTQGQGSSSQGLGSSSSQFSGGSVQVSPTGVSFQTFGKSGSNQSLDKSPMSPTSPHAIGPSSMYPEYGGQPVSSGPKPGIPPKPSDIINKFQTDVLVHHSNEQLNGPPSTVYKSNYGAMSSNSAMPYTTSKLLANYRGSEFGSSVDDGQSVLNDMQASIFDYHQSLSEASSRSVTPPLPPLSNSDSEPSTPSISPRLPRSLNVPSMNNRKTPDLVTSTTGHSSLEKRKKSSGSQGSLHNERKHSGSKSFQKTSQSKPGSHNNGQLWQDHGILSDVRESESDLPFDIEDTILTVDSVDTEIQNMHEGLKKMHDGLATEGSEVIRDRLNKLENLYDEVLRVVGADRDKHVPARRRWSLGSSDTSSIRRPTRKFKSSSSSNQKHHSSHHLKDIKAIQRRFQRLESHVVTLARSVAHLSSELRSHNSMVQELEGLRKEVRELREQQFIASQHAGFSSNGHSDLNGFRGWMPSLTNPKRIHKLTKFFGEEPPLLELFLKKLGYEKFSANFNAEHIGMIELPYMTEDRLEKIGIPMGPRLRILQEAQLCFRQENFKIYIV